MTPYYKVKATNFKIKVLRVKRKKTIILKLETLISNI